MMGGMGVPADPADAPAGQGPALCLPEPTGPCPAGITSLWLRDTARPDPWVAGVSVRELMVSLWYPAASSDGPRARYMTPAACPGHFCSWPISSASTSAPTLPAPGPWTSPAPTSGPSSTCTCAASRKPRWTSRHPATPRSRSAPRIAAKGRSLSQMERWAGSRAVWTERARSSVTASASSSSVRRAANAASSRSAS